MATKISRVFHKIFGDAGATTNFGQFGSEAASVGNKTKDISNIQGLSAWDNGWQDAVNPANKAPFLEDMNSCFYEHSYHLGYVLQEGIPEYDANSFYFIGSIVKRTSTSELYVSLADSNQGHALTVSGDNAYWQYLGNLELLNYSKHISRMYLDSAQSIPHNTDTAVVLDGVDFDLGEDWDGSLFEVPYDGYYRIEASVGYSGTLDTKQYGMTVYDETAFAAVLQAAANSGGTSALSVNVSGLIHLDEGSFISLHAYQQSGVSASLSVDKTLTFMSVELIRKD